MNGSGLAVLNAAAASWAEGILRASWQGGAALLLAWLICRFLPRLSPAAKCWFWRLACLKLLFALLWIAPLELPVLPHPEASGIATAARLTHAGPERIPFRAVRLQSLPDAGSSLLAARVGAPPGGPTAAPPHSQPHLSTAAWLLLAWLLGISWCGWRIAWEWRTVLRLCRVCSPVHDGGIALLWSDLCREAGLRPPPLLSTGAVGSPMLLGGLRPSVVLPEWGLREGALDAVRLMLAHELAHLKRNDLRWGWVRAACQSFFFFHPLVWLAAREWRLVHEMACDEWVVRRTDANVADYGQMLLDVSTRSRVRVHPGLAAVSGHESLHVLRRRLQMLDQFSGHRSPAAPGSRTWTRPAGLAMLPALLVVCLIPWRVVAQDQPAESRPPAGAATSPARGPEARCPAAPPASKPEPRVPAAPASAPAASEPSTPAAGPPERAPRIEAEEPAAVPAGARVSDPGLAEQWEDVLLLEACGYLKLTSAQLRQLLPLARGADERLQKLAEQEKRTRATLTRIARENREALLAGRRGSRQDEALDLERIQRQRRAQTEEEIVGSVLTPLARILSREQVARAHLLALGDPVRDDDRALSAALLDPGSGFVLTAERTQAAGARLRASLLSLQREALRQSLAGRYQPGTLDRALGPDPDPARMLAALAARDPALAARVGAKLDAAKLEVELKARLDAGELPQAAIRAIRPPKLQEVRPGLPGEPFVPVVPEAAQRELEAAQQEVGALMRRPDLRAQLLAGSIAEDQLSTALRPLARRIFLSPRLRPVLEARLGKG